MFSITRLNEVNIGALHLLHGRRRCHLAFFAAGTNISWACSDSNLGRQITHRPGGHLIKHLNLGLVVVVVLHPHVLKQGHGGITAMCQLGSLYVNAALNTFDSNGTNKTTTVLEG